MTLPNLTTTAPLTQRRTWSIVFVCAVILLIKSLTISHDPVHFPLWAEDGIIFIKHSLEHGFSSITTPYAGYLHVITRILSQLCVSVLPLENLPCGFFWVSFIIPLAVFAYVLSTPNIPLFIRLLIPVSVLFSPTDGEVFFTLTNTHWIIALIYPIILFHACTQTWRETAITSFIISAIGINDPHIFIAYPFFIGRIYRFKNCNREKMIFLAASIAFIIQALTLSLSPTSPTMQAETYPDLPTWAKWVLPAFLPFASLFTGPNLLRFAFNHSIFAIGIGIALCLLYATILAAFHSAGKKIFLCMLPYFLFGVLSYASTLFRYRSDPGMFIYSGINRYFFLPEVLFTVSLSFLIVSSRPFARRVGLISLSIILIAGIASFSCNGRIDNEWQQRISELQRNNSTTVKISPGSEWDLQLRLPFTSKHR